MDSDRESDSEWDSLEEALYDAINDDEREELISLIDQNVEICRSKAKPILSNVVGCGAVKCAEALITGQTPLTVDLNSPCTSTGWHPIHVAACLCFRRPSIIELLLHYKASADVRLTTDHISGDKFLDQYDNMLPLQIAFWSSFYFNNVPEWSPKHSVYKLIAGLCLPRNQDILETIALLAGRTKETEEVFLEYAMQGRIIEVAALLMVAYEKVSKVLDRVPQLFDSNEINQDQREKVLSLLQLVKVFGRAGDNISAYVKQDRCNFSEHQTIVDVTRMLREADLDLQHSDVDFSDDTWYWFHRRYSSIGPDGVERCLDDFGMAHYSKSGYRWKVSENDPSWKFISQEAYRNELKNEVENLKEEDVNFFRKEQQQELKLAFGFPYIYREGIPATSRLFSNVALKTKGDNKMFGATVSKREMTTMASSWLNMRNSQSRRAMSSLAFLLERMLKHM